MSTTEISNMLSICQNWCDNSITYQTGNNDRIHKWQSQNMPIPWPTYLLVERTSQQTKKWIILTWTTELYLSKQQSLWFKVNGQTMSLIIEEIFKPEKFDSTHTPVIFVWYGNCKLTRLVKKKTHLLNQWHQMSIRQNSRTYSLPEMLSETKPPEVIQTGMYWNNSNIYP